MGEPGLTFERGHGSVGDDEDARFKFIQMLGQPFETFFRWSEIASSVTKDRVSAPAEIAESDLPFGKRSREPSFEMTVRLGAFDEGVSEEDDAITVPELDGG